VFRSVACGGQNTALGTVRAREIELTRKGNVKVMDGEDWVSHHILYGLC
jgi:hypothetical protein